MALSPEEYNQKFLEMYGIKSSITQVGTPIEASPACQAPIIIGFRIRVKDQHQHITDAVHRRHADLENEYNNILLHDVQNDSVVIRYLG